MANLLYVSDLKKISLSDLVIQRSGVFFQSGLLILGYVIEDLSIRNLSLVGLESRDGSQFVQLDSVSKVSFEGLRIEGLSHQLEGTDFEQFISISHSSLVEIQNSAIREVSGRLLNLENFGELLILGVEFRNLATMDEIFRISEGEKCTLERVEMSGVRSEGNQSSLVNLFKVQEVSILNSTYSECHSKNGEGGLFRITSVVDLLIQNN